METLQAKSKVIRECNNDDRDQQSSRRPVKKVKIIDLNDDCLVKIFGRLDIQSLFSVAVANEWLRPAAGEVYKRKFGAKKVRISECDDYQLRACANAPMLNPETIAVCGLMTSLQFLRCFGS